MRVFALVAALLAPAPVVAGTPCGPDIPAHGVCDGELRVVWCEDGVVKSYDCEPGTKCYWNPDAKPPGWDCLALKCEEYEYPPNSNQWISGIPATGKCVEDHSAVVYCVEGDVEVLYCGAGTSCEHNDAAGAMDCVAGGTEPAAEAEPGLGTDAGASVPDQDAAPARPDAGNGRIGSSDAGVPPPKKPDAMDQQPASGPPGDDEGGCSTSRRPSSAGVLALLALLCLAAGVMRRR